jgi:hypothetical protein
MVTFSDVLIFVSSVEFRPVEHTTRSLAIIALYSRSKPRGNPSSYTVQQVIRAIYYDMSEGSVNRNVDATAGAGGEFHSKIGREGPQQTTGVRTCFLDFPMARS